MIVQYDNGLENQTFIESAEILFKLNILEKNKKMDFNLGNIENPVLACDGIAISKLAFGNVVDYLFTGSNIPLTTSYDGTINTWFKVGNTWPPSIDTLVHLEGQRKVSSLKQAEMVLDVACGTGMAGGYAANQNPNIKHIWFSDIDPEAVFSALKNSDFLDRKNITCFQKVDALKGMKEKYDVIIACSIPATPSFPGLQRPINPLFEGTQLLEDLLKDAPKRLNKNGKLILSHSSLGDKAFDEFAKKYGARVDAVLNEKQVPFRVEFLDDQNWVDYLVQNHGMHEVSNGNSRGYPYWHTQRVKEISFK